MLAVRLFQSSCFEGVGKGQWAVPFIKRPAHNIQWSMIKFIRRCPQVVFLKRPRKGAINSSFFREVLQISSTFYQLQFGKNIMLKQNVSSIDKIYQSGILKVVVLKRCTKGTLSSSFYFCTVAFSSLLSEKRQWNFYF